MASGGRGFETMDLVQRQPVQRDTTLPLENIETVLAASGPRLGLRSTRRFSQAPSSERTTPIGDEGIMLLTESDPTPGVAAAPHLAVGPRGGGRGLS